MLHRLKKYFRSLFFSYRKIPDKKVYVEFITAVLSVPVLLTVILLNVTNLRSQQAPKTEEKDTGGKVIYIPTTPTEKTSSTPTASEPCKKELPPLSITSPEEGESIDNNPVFVDISYSKGGYCAIVWSYRINGGRWSDYTDRSIALYNPQAGNITFELRYKSIATGEEDILRRNFSYKGSGTVATPTQSVGTSSATLN